MAVDSKGQDVAARLREVEDAFGGRTHLSDATGYAKSTLQSWVGGRTAPPFTAVVEIATTTGYSLEWLAFGVEPKRPVVDDADVAEAVAGGWINGELLEDILSKIRRFMMAKRQPLTREAYERLGHQLYNQVARFPTAPERNAALQVLLEQRLPEAWDALSAHDRIAARRFWSPPEEPCK